MEISTSPAAVQTRAASPPPFIVGVVSDTHVPDRVSQLHPLLLPSLEQAGVKLILHAGDICSSRVLRELTSVAPVEAVQGNRDIPFYASLPLVRRLDIAGVPLALMHGHGGLLQYLIDKIQYLAVGYELKRYLKYMQRAAPWARVLIFGHSHHLENAWHAGQLVFNPGSASFGFRRRIPPTYGLLSIEANGSVSGRVLSLQHWSIQNRAWVPLPEYNKENEVSGTQE